MKLTLRADWYQREIAQTIDVNGAGIYQWSIAGVGVYIGKAKVLRKRLNAYPNNVRRMLEGKSWHSNPARDYRTVHRALRQAYEAASPVVVTVLETCDPADLPERELHWIRVRQEEERSGGPRVLNQTPVQPVLAAEAAS